MKKKRKTLLVILLLPFYLITKYAPLLIKIISKSKILSILFGVDSTIGFASKDISTIISWIIICIIGFDAHQEISKEMYGDFRNKLGINIAVIFSAFVITLFLLPGSSLEPHLQIFHLHIPSPPVGVFVTILLLYVLVFSLITNKIIWKESNLEQKTGPGSRFWETVGTIEHENAFDKYLRDTKIPNSKIKRVQMMAWWYAPGLVIAALCVLYGIIFWILTVSSLIFIAFLILWLIGRLKRRTPENTIFGAVVSTLRESHSKGLFGIILMIVGYLSCLLFLYPILWGIVQKKLPMTALFILLPFIYLFYFWYLQTRRLPVFIRVWTLENKNYEETEIISLPCGGYKGFGYICALLCIWGLSLKYIQSLASFLLSSLPLSVMALLMLGLSFKNEKQWMPQTQVLNENFKIILSLIVQLACILLLAYIVQLDPTFVARGIMLAMLLVFIWYYPDWCNLLKRWCKRESIKRVLLGYGIVLVGFLPLLGLRAKLTTVLYWIVAGAFTLLIIEEILRIKVQSNK
ncbi:hypothetical protein KAW65_00205 [candidate division WOR-3 bacterium]|nr:hypothetical protein [candidate division WOR-3 bacterium]